MSGGVSAAEPEPPQCALSPIADHVPPGELLSPRLSGEPGWGRFSASLPPTPCSFRCGAWPGPVGSELEVCSGLPVSQVEVAGKTDKLFVLHKHSFTFVFLRLAFVRRGETWKVCCELQDCVGWPGQASPYPHPADRCGGSPQTQDHAHFLMICGLSFCA